jgi:multidrug efflux pump
VALRHRAAIVVGGLLVTVGAVFVFRSLEREFVPPEDRGWFFSFIIAPEGASLAYTDGYQRRAEAILAKTEGIESYFSVVNIGDGVSRGIIFTDLVDWSDRDRSVQEIIDEVQGQYFGIPGVFAFANNPPAFGWGSPVNFVIQHPDFDLLVKGNDTLLSRAQKVPGLINVDSDLRVNKPQLTVSFDRDRAEDLGVPVADVATTLQVLLGGTETSTFTRANKQYDVIVQLDPRARSTPSDMTGLYVRGRGNELVKLEALATVKEEVGPRALNHFNRVRSATITASLAPGFTLGQAIDSLSRIADEVLPRGSSTALAGESRELEESGTSLYFAFILALIVVFMVLASQFESLVHPFTVLLAVPLAVTGALVTLKFAGSTLNVYSQIGMILLIGLVTKNSILLVEYINQLKERGMTTIDAAKEAGRIRLRPILMTSVATVMGALPIALGLGAGSLSRRPLGYAIVGGLLFSTLLTLYVVPAVYVIFDGLLERARRREAGHRRPLAPAEAE